MATKNEPGDYDCYANADPEEPMFVLLGRDAAASAVVRHWVRVREALRPGADREQLKDAVVVALEMERWAEDLDKSVEGADVAESAVLWKRGVRVLLENGMRIWQEEGRLKDEVHQSLEQIVVRLGVTVGDLARIARDVDKDEGTSTRDHLECEMGNVIFSCIRWCSHLGLDPVVCIERAMEAQRKFVKENERR
jgi:hypothetical protein